MQRTPLHRLTCLLLCAVLLLGLGGTALAYTASPWAQPEMEAAQTAGIIPEGLLQADLTARLTRQEMCDIVVHTFQEMTGVILTPASKDHFNDTQAINICIAAELGIVDGYPDGSFRPNHTITRQEYAQVVSNFYTALGWDPSMITLTVFSDYRQVSSWARSAGATAVRLGFVNGNANGTLAPLQNTSREQALAVMLRLYVFMMDYLGLPLPDQTTEPVEPVQPTEPAAPTAAVESTESGESAAAVMESPEPADPAAAAAPEEDAAGAAADDETVEPAAAPETLPAPEPLLTEQTTVSGYSCSSWAEVPMEQAAEYGLIPESLLTADLTQNITRAEICHAAVQTYEALLQTGSQPQATDHFSDTDDPIINLAYEQKLINGFTDGTFRPAELMVRQQFFQIIANLVTAAGWVDTSVQETLSAAFADYTTIGDWALDAAALMSRTGIMQGDNHQNMNPTGLTTREQGIAMFLRAHQYIHDWYKANPLTKIEGPLTVNSKAQEIVRFALQFEGCRYVYGGTTPAGFDCSGFTQYVFTQCGYPISRTTHTQKNDGYHVDQSQLMPGDLLLFYNSSRTDIGHAALYIGDGMMIHAQSSSTGVCITPLERYQYRYYDARRIV